MPRTFKDHALKWLIGLLAFLGASAGASLWAHEARLSALESIEQRDAEFRMEVKTILRDIQRRLPPSNAK